MKKEKKRRKKTIKKKKKKKKEEEREDGYVSKKLEFAIKGDCRYSYISTYKIVQAREKRTRTFSE